jgi:two-component system, OmpR family, sensor histidine kinase VicK
LIHSTSQPPPSAVRERTEILYGTENVLVSILDFLSKAKRIDSCGDSKSPSLAFEVDIYRKLLADIKNKGIRVRQVTGITKENIRYCKELLKFGYEIRHLDDIKANFSVSETEYLATAAALRESQPIPQIIYSNVKDIVEQQRYVFESFWNRAILAETRINEIERGIESEKTHVIQDPQTIQKSFVDMVKLAQHEVLLILPTVNAFLREHRIGIIQLLVQAAKERSANVRILTPTNAVIDDLLKNMEVLSYQEGERTKDFDLDLRSINMSSEGTAVSTVTIVVVDKKESLVFEKTDDTKENFIEAVGSATYSNSKPTVMSYVSIFKNLWKQVDLYEQLKTHDKMQKEFINIASHEMKTPTQAIVGYADLIKKHPEKRDDMMQAISRNAVRLQRLTNDILDVTRIDSNTLNLHKELFNLDDVIANVIQDYVGYIEKENLNVKLLYTFKQDINEPILVDADRDRIAQVISNLLSNAIKFTSKRMDGVIFVSAERKKNSNQEEVSVSIKDTGEGINPEIQPRLFTKFATRSFSGTGLGLYISKSIVEAHGGKMLAENNPDGNGATFTFTLPINR